MSGPVRARTYQAATAAETAMQFEADASEAAAHGWFPSSQVWEGTALTVMYQRHEETPPVSVHEPADSARGAQAPVGVAPIAAAATGSSTLSIEERRRILSQAVQGEVARGARVQSQDDRSAVLIYGKPVNHVLHAILTIFLLGLWLFVWIPMALFGGEHREMISVDDWGRVSQQRL
jgi:hypothetical protein